MVASLLRHAGSLLVLLVYLLAGEAITRLARLPVPGSVVGMVLLAVSLRRGWLRMERVRPAAELLVRHMAFLFVPPGVGLMLYFDLIRAEWPALAVAGAAGTAAVLITVGVVHQRMSGRA